MDFEKLLDRIAEQDRIRYTVTDNDGLSNHVAMSIVSVTMFGDSVELMGEGELRLEFPINSVISIEYTDKNTILITRDSGIICLYLDETSPDIR